MYEDLPPADHFFSNFVSLPEISLTTRFFCTDNGLQTTHFLLGNQKVLRRTLKTDATVGIEYSPLLG